MASIRFLVLFVTLVVSIKSNNQITSNKIIYLHSTYSAAYLCKQGLCHQWWTKYQEKQKIILKSTRDLHNWKDVIPFTFQKTVPRQAECVDSTKIPQKLNLYYWCTKEQIPNVHLDDGKYRNQLNKKHTIIWKYFFIIKKLILKFKNYRRVNILQKHYLHVL